MELKAIDPCRIVFLTQVTRPAGQLFLPVAIGKLIARYKFQKSPGPSELVGPPFTFQHGAFNDVAIDEFSIYNDGVIAVSRSNTKIIDAFLDDLISWAESELGLREISVPPREKHYESSLVIAMDIKATKALPYGSTVANHLTRFQQDCGLPGFTFDFGSIALAVDTTKYPGRKPIPFTLTRRINVPFDAGIYYSTAPLKTDDHLSLLNEIESLLR